MICPLAFLGLVRARRGDHLLLGLQDLSDAFGGHGSPHKEPLSPRRHRPTGRRSMPRVDMLKGMSYSLLFTVYGFAMTSPS